MSARRLITYLVLATICLAPVTTTAQSPSPQAAELASDRLFSVTIPRDLLPDTPTVLSWDEMRIEPGAGGAFGDPAAFLSRGIYVLEGEATLTLPVEALAWQGGAAVDREPTTVAADEPIALTAGELVYVPHQSAMDTGAPSHVSIVNEGEVPARIVGFQMHDGMSVSHHAAPDGVTSHAITAPVMAPHTYVADPISFTLDRVTIAPGQKLQPDPTVPASFYQVVAGRLTYTWTTPDEETTIAYTWAPRIGRWMPWAEDVTVTLAPAGDEPVTLLVLVIAPRDVP